MRLALIVALLFIYLPLEVRVALLLDLMLCLVLLGLVLVIGALTLSTPRGIKNICKGKFYLNYINARRRAVGPPLELIGCTCEADFCGLSTLHDIEGDLRLGVTTTDMFTVYTVEPRLSGPGTSLSGMKIL